MQTTQTIWSGVLDRISSVITPEQFSTWFRDISFEQDAPELAVIRVPNAFYSNWFERHYTELIAGAVAELTGVKPAIQYEITPRTLTPEPADLNREVVAPQNTTPRTIQSVTENELKLNRNYIFSSFITGPSNQLAHAAALAAVEAPGVAYNPLFLHGGVGLGKTHLMHAVAHALQKKKHGLIIKYLSCESFMNQFIYAVQKGGMEQFRARYRQVDVLMIDDIHTLAGRQRTQEEFFHTFNELYNAHKQIIISADNAPEDIPQFEERLISRFKWGMVARIDLPCFDTRVAIIHKKAELLGKVLADDVIHFIAEAVPTNIRELEGAVLKVIGYASLLNRKADLGLVREILRTAAPAQAASAPLSCENIQKVVADWYGVPTADLRARSRTRSLAFPRQVAMHLTRKLTSRSLFEIGRAFDRDHSTVVHACERIDRELQMDKSLAATLEAIEKKIQKI